jgi:nicotinamide-nucleotide amidase
MNEVEGNSRIATLKLCKWVAIGYYPVFPELHISLTIRKQQSSQCNAILSQTTKAIYEALGDVVYGQNQDSMETVVGRLLSKKKLLFAVAESCTGGLLSHKITKVPGSSAYYLGGITSDADSMKATFLGVPEPMLQRHGAVSKEVAATMAVSIRERTGADLSLSITGIAGPDGGSTEKPVGTVYIGFSSAKQCFVRLYHFDGSREQIQEMTAVTGLDLIRRYLLDLL